MIVKQFIVASVAVATMFSSIAAAARPATTANPDFTQGDKIPEGANHDWTLGATGARGWMFSDRLVTTDARQIAITEVEKNSPADGILAVGDVILGVGGKPFSYDPRTELGKALTTAESEAGSGNLSLIRWRAGKTENVVVKLPVLGTYSATAPYDCPKSQRILEQGCNALALRIADPSYRQNPITRSLNALALLASGDPEYLPLVKKEAQWAADYSADSFQTWYYGYVIMLLSEYVMETGDDSVMPGLRRLALEAANGQSIVGSWGHRFARPDGRLGGYGMMNSPGLPLTISLILAREAGVDDPKLGEAIEKSARLIRFYIGKGAVPYGDHHPWIETHEDNGKCGMASVMFNLLGEAEGAEFFSRMSVASHGPERDTGHTGNFFNILWSLPGVAQSGPHATGAWMQEFGAWYFDLARRWDGTFLHQGPPQLRHDSYGNWDCTGGYLLAYAMPLKKIYLTGRRESSFPQIDASVAQSLINDGRGWSNKDRNSAYDELGTEQLVTHLSSWSPTVRERAAMALGRREDDVTAHLIRLLDAPDFHTRYGACQAIKMQRQRGAAAVPALVKAFRSDDLWLRILAADALAGIGEPAKAAVPDMLVRLTKSDPKNDPRNMEQRYLCFALFNQRGGLLGRSLEGVDRESLYAAVRAGLCNEDGRARGSIGSVYRNLSYEEIEPLLPAICHAVVEPAPSGIMFADGIRLEGLRLLAKHRVKEGIGACVTYTRTQNPWASEKRTPELMKILLGYGAHAKSTTAELEQIADYFENDEENFPRQLSLEKAKVVRETVRAIEASDEYPELIRIE
ncbi:MAG: HEAT repeat domain-containing protein [Planctomycetes bacterium]|nr:HEAT repeat domain-containing protein [Planctomycetota bacterium]MBL7037021.1 HEAT repeat domain-containing protein [Pirellulaceae bacterium]